MALRIVDETSEIWGEDAFTESATVQRDCGQFAETGA